MTTQQLTEFVVANYDDFFFTKQMTGVSDKQMNKMISEILQVLFEHRDFATSEAVRTLYSNLPAEVLALLPRHRQGDSRVPILPLRYRSDHYDGISSVPTNLKKKYRGTDVPLQLGSARMRLMALFGMLNPEFCDKSLTQEQVTELLSDEN